MIKLYFSAALMLGTVGLKAQDSMISSGGEAAGSGGTISYTIGQVAYSSSVNASGSVAEGVQQPFEISGPNALAETNGLLLLVSTYPNPTTDFLILKVEHLDLSALSFQLYDIKGMLLEHREIKDIETRITMSNYMPSTYILKVKEGNKEISAFKIIKQE
jgi:hypothetical protein